MNKETENVLSEFEQVTTIYGSFKQRTFASLIDGLILLPLVAVDWFNKSGWKSQLLLIATFLIALLYKIFFEYKYGATIGKKAMQLIVVNKDLLGVNLKEVLVRNVFDITWKTIFFVIDIITYRSTGFINVTSNEQFVAFQKNLINVNPYLLVYFLVIIIEVVFILTDKKRRALHDRMGDTFVIKAKFR
ncbi:MAG: RDD family protein [Ferruginibacter sp.]